MGVAEVGVLITQKSTTTKKRTTENSREKPKIATEAVVTARRGGQRRPSRVVFNKRVPALWLRLP